MTRHTCRHCGARIYPGTGDGRYRWTDVADGSDILGSGSECRSSERGHDPVDARARCGSRAGLADSLHHPDGTHKSTPASASGRALERHADALARHLSTLPD